ncbi:TetR/AcrR family transcriptional regulator [Oleomonas cavernae]|uniref:TetR/AcrR family transcriptional regulator n=1 Tax=Oleomonas cavernae TaxID=2320859 RepID=A0A418VTQ7_9PROT|nr:TetR/AcrR family transcriptional regulator [Oleomonas cavernae]RJF80539.1 TetR/AcrR family transcriptional regulator [Oleomonas cavernae]
MTIETGDITAETSRFQRKRDLIVDAAAVQINQRGIKGMALADVAESVGLSTTSVTYYFKRKDLLAGACFDRALDRLDVLVATAEAEGDARARVTRYVELNFDMLTRIRNNQEQPVARLSDLRALDEPMRGQLMARYFRIYRRVRHFWDSDGSEGRRALRTARAHVLLETVFWLQAWLPLYEVEDYDRIRRRLLELYALGLAPSGTCWAPRLQTLDEPEEDTARRHFLVAATRLINERGYRGASVDRIASELNVTKGSFYHHLDAKDDLVLACFRHSLDTLALAQRKAALAGDNYLDRLASATATLLEIQFSATAAPLLRTTALQALPEDLRAQVVERSNMLATRFAGLIIDGITQGSIAPIDPLVASQSLMPLLNAAYELRHWAAPLGAPEAIRLYASTLFFGLFDRPSSQDETETTP